MRRIYQLPLLEQKQWIENGPGNYIDSQVISQLLAAREVLGRTLFYLMVITIYHVCASAKHPCCENDELLVSKI